MINYKKAKKDFIEIKNIMKKYDNLIDFIKVLEKEKTFNITNKFNDNLNHTIIDMNYKSLCVTIREIYGALIIEDYVEIWDDNQGLNFEFRDINSI